VKHDKTTVLIQGVLALVGGREVAVGNSRLLAGQGIYLTDEQAAEEAAWQAKGAPLISHKAACVAAVGLPSVCVPQVQPTWAVGSSSWDPLQVRPWCGSPSTTRRRGWQPWRISRVLEPPQRYGSPAVLTGACQSNIASSTCVVASAGAAPQLVLTRRQAAPWQAQASLGSLMIVQRIPLFKSSIAHASGQRHPAAGAAHGHADRRLRRRGGGGGRCGGAAAGGRARRPAAGRQARQGGSAQEWLTRYWEHTPDHPDAVQQLPGRCLFTVLMRGVGTQTLRMS
jgi:hypothetical protein